MVDGHNMHHTPGTSVTAEVAWSLVLLLLLLLPLLLLVVVAVVVVVVVVVVDFFELPLGLESFNFGVVCALRGFGCCLCLVTRAAVIGRSSRCTPGSVHACVSDCVCACVFVCVVMLMVVDVVKWGIKSRLSRVRICAREVVLGVVEIFKLPGSPSSDSRRLCPVFECVREFAYACVCVCVFVFVFVFMCMCASAHVCVFASVCLSGCFRMCFRVV